MILIDTEMPKNCKECFAYEEHEIVARCKIKGMIFGKHDEWTDKERNTWCPLVELKTMGECYKH